MLGAIGQQKRRPVAEESAMMIAVSVRAEEADDGTEEDAPEVQDVQEAAVRSAHVVAADHDVFWHILPSSIHLILFVDFTIQFLLS
jgi:hypothetical protein